MGRPKARSPVSCERQAGDMKTAVRDTSIDAYHSQDFSHLQQEVLSALRVLGEGCISDIAAYLNLERCTVAARLNELKHAGAIVFLGKRKSQRTGIMSEFWRIAYHKKDLF